MFDLSCVFFIGLVIDIHYFHIFIKILSKCENEDSNEIAWSWQPMMCGQVYSKYIHAYSWIVSYALSYVND